MLGFSYSASEMGEEVPGVSSLWFRTKPVCFPLGQLHQPSVQLVVVVFSARQVAYDWLSPIQTCSTFNADNAPRLTLDIPGPFLQIPSPRWNFGRKSTVGSAKVPSCFRRSFWTRSIIFGSAYCAYRHMVIYIHWGRTPIYLADKL